MKILWIILVGLWLLNEAECGQTRQKHLGSRKYGRGRTGRKYRVRRQPLCEHGSCYPAVGNLLTGRAGRLHASSTCGLHEPQKYCVVSDLNKNMCYICDSRRHNAETSHRIQNVVPSFSSGPVRTWWQSENGLQDVSIRLDLEAEFHITHMIITFKTFRPAAAVIERSVNLGRTWQPYRYFAYDCANVFPGIPVRKQLWVGDVVCESRYSAIEPSSNGELIFKVLDPRLLIMDPYSKRIQDLLRVTNLRVNFTRLHTLGDNLLHPHTKVQQKYYYAVYEMVVRGNCFCYGHASQCIPVKRTEVMVPGMVHGRCLCTHNTAGINCERCKKFHMDTPWAPARDRHAYACKRCNCNGHSDKCYFDMAAFIASGNVSGGVCDDCQHNTAGRHCQLCRPSYYRHPRHNARSHDACVPCNCDKRGTKDGGHCDGLTNPTLGQIGGGCRCKANVEGDRCDRCKPGHFGLDINNYMGCHPCACDPRGTVSGTATCDPLTGSCTCKRMVTGLRCDQCQKGHWGLSFAEPNGCYPCTCDFGGAYDDMCNPVDGQCHCRPHMQGKSCTHPAPGYFCMETYSNVYEAEAAHLVHSSANMVTVVRRRKRIGEVTWTGSGFTKMHDGTGLEFSISDISHSMYYHVVIRYELETWEKWRAELTVLGWSTDVLSSECESFNPMVYKQEVKLHKSSRNVAFPEAVCLKKGVIYTVRIHLWSEASVKPRPSTTLLIDSIVLRPGMSRLLQQGEASLRPGMLGCLLSPLQRLQRMPHHNCTQILCSISAIIHDGAIPCACDRLGSKSDICAAIGGQCPCHPLVTGRKCDTCTPQTYGHRPGSCKPCRCDPRGSAKEVCDARTGQCECHVGKAGLRCDKCEPGHWEYPRCLPCNCRGKADHCDANTGICLNCRGNSTGRHCENCLDGYYEHPGVGPGCIQCPCPGHPRNRVNAHSCHRHHVTRHMVCQCLPAYRGKKCELCAVGHYGHPLSPHGHCRPCDCSGNTDMMAEDSCHPQTGECLKCLHNSAGPHCAVCRDGYHGNASLQQCKECQCNPLGTNPEACSLSGGLCRCQHITGKCPCLPGVHGHTCSRCNLGYWGLHSGGGCKPCRCNPTHSVGSRCHPDTGQCHCLHGYGGLTCDSCQEDHWGRADTYCLPCNCSHLGVATSGRICKASTGHCLCRDGATGRRCEKCMRGFHREQGRPCKECHVCFKLWNKAISELLTEAAELFSRPLDMCMGNSSWNGELDEVERIIDEVREIMDTLPDLNSPVHDFQNQISQTWRKVEALSRTLNTSRSEVEDIDRWLKHALVEVASIGRETIKLDRMLQEIRQQKDNLPDATSTSAPDIVVLSYIKDIKEAYAKSSKAEEQTIQAATGPRSPIRRSESIRKQTTNVFENALKIQQNNTNIVKNMSTLVNNVGVDNLSRKVCGSNMSKSCDEALSCGGTPCKESHGWWCGGDRCKGLAQLSKNTLNDANAASIAVAELLTNLSRQLSQVEKVKKNASDAKSIANKSVLRASDAIEIVQNASGGIDDILRRYNDFSIGVHPSEVEDLAFKALNITLPASDAEINMLIAQITSALEAFDKIDVKLTLEAVQNMSKKAQDARKQALKTNSEVEKAKRTLNEVDIIQKDTEQKMDVANDRVQKSSEELEQAKLQMRAVDLNMSETGYRLARLGAAVKQLQMKTNIITDMVEEIKEDVNNSSKDAQQVDQNLQTVSLNLDNLQEKYADKAKVSASINGRIGDLVEKLVDITDVQNMLQKIKDQKKKISEQKEMMQARQKQIENMNKEVKVYKKKIDDVILKYNHCALLR
uniref:laminin subunit beta-2-like n=1 Tax=Myxine glutinosa TaxID=7769 RepID=UPI00358FA603